MQRNACMPSWHMGIWILWHYLLNIKILILNFECFHKFWRNKRTMSWGNLIEVILMPWGNKYNCINFAQGRFKQFPEGISLQKIFTPPRLLIDLSCTCLNDSSVFLESASVESSAIAQNSHIRLNCVNSRSVLVQCPFMHSLICNIVYLGIQSAHFFFFSHPCQQQQQSWHISM